MGNENSQIRDTFHQGIASTRMWNEREDPRLVRGDRPSSSLMSLIIVVVIGLGGSLAGALQSQALGVMEEKVGTLASTFVTYASGGLAIAALMLAFQGGRLSEMKQLPWWVFTAGIMGLVVVASLGVTVSRLGLGAGLTLFTGATLVIGAVIEHLGWFGGERSLDATRLTGIGLVIAGTWLVVRG